MTNVLTEFGSYNMERVSSYTNAVILYCAKKGFTPLHHQEATDNGYCQVEEYNSQISSHPICVAGDNYHEQ